MLWVPVRRGVVELEALGIQKVGEKNIREGLRSIA